MFHIWTARSTGHGRANLWERRPSREWLPKAKCDSNAQNLTMGRWHAISLMVETIFPYADQRQGRGSIAMTKSGILLQGVVSATVCDVDPERIILFGSRARGDARPDSDLDLLVVEREPFSAQRSRQEELKRIRRVLWRFRRPIVVPVYSRDEIDEWRNSPNHVIGRSLREGVTVYETH